MVVRDRPTPRVFCRAGPREWETIDGVAREVQRCLRCDRILNQHRTYTLGEKVANAPDAYCPGIIDDLD